MLVSEFAQQSFSQLGEDILISNLLSERAFGFYVDVGAFHPFIYSNTALLSRSGNWRGINIDPSPKAKSLFDKHRPNDVNLMTGVSDRRGELRYFQFKNGAFSTFDERRAEKLMGRGEILEDILKVECKALSDILDKESVGHIDYMNVDCEGLDQAVLASNDWSRWKPDLITVEIHGLELIRPTENMTVRFLIDQNYKFIAFARPTAFFQL